MARGNMTIGTQQQSAIGRKFSDAYRDAAIKSYEKIKGYSKEDKAKLTPFNAMDYTVALAMDKNRSDLMETLSTVSDSADIQKGEGYDNGTFLLNGRYIRVGGNQVQTNMTMKQLRTGGSGAKKLQFSDRSSLRETKSTKTFNIFLDFDKIKEYVSGEIKKSKK